MKNILITAAVLTLAGFAQAEDLIKLERSSGFVPPGMASSVECTISSQGAMISAYAGANMNETKGYANGLIYTAKVANVAAIKKMIAQAAKGKLLETPAPTDGPNYSLTGIIEGKVIDQYVKLYRSYTSGGNIGSNSAKAAVDALGEFADLNCNPGRIKGE